LPGRQGGGKEGKEGERGGEQGGGKAGKRSRAQRKPSQEGGGSGGGESPAGSREVCNGAKKRGDEARGRGATKTAKQWQQRLQKAAAKGETPKEDVSQPCWRQ
jgi:hypothetical protein